VQEGGLRIDLVRRRKQHTGCVVRLDSFVCNNETKFCKYTKETPWLSAKLHLESGPGAEKSCRIWPSTSKLWDGVVVSFAFLTPTFSNNEIFVCFVVPQTEELVQVWQLFHSI
jgi:hypothetical protein